MAHEQQLVHGGAAKTPGDVPALILPRGLPLVPRHLSPARALAMSHRAENRACSHDDISLAPLRPSPCRGCCARAAAAGLPGPPGNAIHCRVIRKGDDIGTAVYLFERQGESLRVDLAVDLVVRLGPVPLFRYNHRTVESWQGDTLVGYDAKTNDNGTPKYMSARRGPAGLEVTGSGTRPYTAPPDAMGTTYWNIRGVSVPLIDTEDGHLLAVHFTAMGTTQVALANGTRIAALQYNMIGELKLDLWYGPGDQLASMRYYAKDGSVLTYERS